MAADPFEFIDREYGHGQIPSALEQELFHLAPSINHSSSSNKNVSTLPGSAEEDPKAASAATSGSHKKKSQKKESSSCRRRRRLRGAQLRTTSSSDSDADADGDAEPTPEAPSTRTLPSTILNPNANPHAVLPTLEQVVRRCSREPDTALDDADLLDVGEMIGIHFDPPSWWRPGGYD